jgi:tetratricopeptide (TPR) repeat protein
MPFAHCQSFDPLNEWPQEMDSERRDVKADEIILQYRFADNETRDSVINYLYEVDRNSEFFISDWTHFVVAQLEKWGSNFKASLIHLDSTIALTRDPYLYIKAHSNKARIHTVLDQMDIAFTHFNVALQGSKQMGYSIVECRTLTGMAEFYRKRGEFETGLDYLDSAQQIVDEQQIFDDVNISIYDRRSAIYSQLNLLYEQLKYSKMALELAEEQENKHAQAVSHNELGFYYENKENFDSSYYHYSKSMELWGEIEADRYSADVHSNMARLMMKNGKRGEAKKYLFSAEEISAGREWYRVYPGLYYLISVVYKEEGDSTNFYKYQQKMVQANFDFYRAENENRLLELEMELKDEKNKAALAKQEREFQKDKDKEQVKKESIITILTVIIIGLSVALIFMFGRRIIKDKRA